MVTCPMLPWSCDSLYADAVTIVLFKVLGAFSNIPFDPNLGDDQRTVTPEAVSHTSFLSLLLLSAYTCTFHIVQ